MKMKHEKPSDYYCEHDGCTYKTRYEFQISKHMANKHVSHTRRVSLIMLTRTLQIYTIIKRPLFVYGRASGSGGSAFCFPYNSVTVRRILFKFGKFRQ